MRLPLLTLPLLSFALLSWAPPAAGLSGDVLINNGLAPPNPDNVLDSIITEDPATGIPGQVRVQNVGCDFWVADPCVSPGAATTVQLLPGFGFDVLGSVFVRETSVILFDGGKTEWLVASDAAHLEMTGGSIAESITFLGSATALITGGTQGAGADLSGHSRVVMTGGALGTTPTNGVGVNDSASLSIFGGDFGELTVRDDAVVRLYGTDFAVDGVPVPFGPAPGGFRLSGTLLSGDSFEVDYAVQQNGVILLLPEPELLWLAAVGGALAVRRRKPRG